jgi:LacI family transcriptional regulator
MATTIKEIAAKAKVSIATVSRVLNNDSKVSDETRKKILRYSNQLNYRPNILARSFVKKKPNLIGLILPEISDEFFTEVIKGVDDIAFDEHYYTIVASSHKYESLEEEVIALIRNGLISGLILLVSDLNKKMVSILSESHLPVVLINSNPDSKKFDAVTIDDYKGAYTMTKHLIKEKKYIRLAHITGPPDNDDSIIRKLGFIDACRKFGIKYSIEEGDFTRESGFTACKKLLNGRNQPQVIFAANDMMAIGCYDFIKQNNLRIPIDIGVVGFDDIFVSQYLTPPLTTVRVQIEEIGQKAADLLLKRIKNEDNSPKQTVNISTELVIRGSC